MKKNYFLLFAVALMGVVATSFAACQKIDNPPVNPSPVTVSPESLEFPAEGDTKTVTVTGENWTATTNDYWITVEPSEGSFTVTVAANPIVVERRGSITVGNGVETQVKTLEIVQAGTGATPASTFTGNQELGTLPLGAMVHGPDASGISDYFQGQSMSSGITLGGRGAVMGSGWLISHQFHTTRDSENIPDGVYEIAKGYDNAPWHVLGGFPNNMAAGMWVRLYENNVMVKAAPVVAGTVTSTYANGEYTIVVNGFDDIGNAISGTLIGVGVSLE